MKQKLKLITAFMCGAVFFSSVSYAATELKARVTDYKVVVNGKELEKLKAPVSINGSTYLPVRSFAETLGYKVDFKSGVILLDKQEASPTSKPSSTPTSTNAPLPTPTPTPTVTPTPTAAPNNKLELLKAENERHAAEIQKIENSYTKSKDYIDSQINQIRRENNVGYLSTEEYDKKVSNLLNELSGLQSQLNLAMFDDSYDGKAKRKNLQEKIDKIDQEMTDLQQARGAQLQIQALEDTLKTRTEGYYAELKEENEKHQRILNSL